MSLRRRHRRWIALIALFGLLFQQFAMTVYACPLDGPGSTVIATASQLPPCHSPNSPDRVRCHEHCHPLAQSADHAPLPSVPAAILPATTWLREPGALSISYDFVACAIEARATAPPLTIQLCTFQI
jgi:hypothetical protein